MVNPVILKEEKRPKNKFKFAKIITPILATCCILIAGVLLLFKDPPITQVNANVSKPHQVYGMQAITLFNFANNNDNNIQKLSNIKRLKKVNLNNSNQNYQELATTINSYLASATNILNSSNVKYSETTSDNQNYKYKMIIEITTLGYIEEYILYFNEQALSNNVKYDDINEVSSKIEGIIKTSDDEFILEGKKEISQQETEIELKMYLSTDKKEYYEVSQEIEKGENEYSFSHYLNNEEIEEFEISVEETNNIKKVTVEKSNELLQTEIEIDFVFVENYIYIECEINDYEGFIKAYLEQNYIKYMFDEKNIINLPIK